MADEAPTRPSEGGGGPGGMPHTAGIGAFVREHKAVSIAIGAAGVVLTAVLVFHSNQASQNAAGQTAPASGTPAGQPTIGTTDTSAALDQQNSLLEQLAGAVQGLINQGSTTAAGTTPPAAGSPATGQPGGPSGWPGSPAGPNPPPSGARGPWQGGQPPTLPAQTPAKPTPTSGRQGGSPPVTEGGMAGNLPGYTTVLSGVSHAIGAQVTSINVAPAPAPAPAPPVGLATVPMQPGGRRMG